MIKCTLEDLYEFNLINNSVKEQKIKVNTRQGLKIIENIAITAKNSIQHEITTNTGKKIIGSPDHLLFHKKWKKIKDFNKGDFIETQDGIEYIYSNTVLKEKEDLLDIQVKDIQEFYANKFVSHNSTISDVLTFVLYGKVGNKNKNDIVNRTNGNLYVDINLVSKGKQVNIIRGLKPGIFNITVNGIEIDNAKLTSMQNFIEDEVLDIPYHVFNNMLVLSVNDFKSFLTLSPSEKRLIVDKIFGFSILNQMKESVKNERKELKINIDTLETKINSLKETSNNIENKILNENLLDLSKIDSYNSEIEILNNEIIEIKNKLELLDTKIQELENKKNKINNNSSKDSTTIKTISRTIKVYEEGKCPLCLNTLEHNHSIPTDLLLELKTLNDNIESYKKSILEINTNIEKCNTIYSTLRSNKNKKETEIKILKSKIQELSKKESNLQDIHEDLKIKIKNESSSLIEIKEQDIFLNTFEAFIGEDGIKKMALASLIPSLNTAISSLCADLHLPYIIQFDDKFNSLVYTHSNEEIPIGTLSLGQKKVADFICLISLLKVLKFRFPTVNILFLDEIFSSIDNVRIYEIIKSLRTLCEEMNLHIFVVNHAPLPSEYFDSIFETSMEKGFSKITITNT